MMFRLHVPYIFGNKQNSKEKRAEGHRGEIRGKTEGREARGRPRKTRERQS